ncbi:MAG TPA: diacylglycerol kinase family protein, partial [Vicinamibacteria bacterium]|nr:diacylglycerol kinase family protein [Vicinamibacteria bacterium]
MRVRAILNPRAGVDAGRALETLRRGRPSWPELTVRLTEGPRNARELAREAVAEGTDLLLVAGGDGTVNEAAQGMIGSETMLGVVPMGSGNGLARSLGIPLHPGQALSALEAGVPRRMDVGLVNGEPFLNVAGAGFDAAVG